MEPSKEAIAVRLARLNRLILGKGPGATANNNLRKKIDREALLDALTVLYDDCNDDPVKKGDELVRVFVDKCKCCRHNLGAFVYIANFVIFLFLIATA